MVAHKSILSCEISTHSHPFEKRSIFILVTKNIFLDANRKMLADQNIAHIFSEKLQSIGIGDHKLSWEASLLADSSTLCESSYFDGETYCPQSIHGVSAPIIGYEVLQKRKTVTVSLFHFRHDCAQGKIIIEFQVYLIEKSSEMLFLVILRCLEFPGSFPRTPNGGLTAPLNP